MVKPLLLALSLAFLARAAEAAPAAIAYDIRPVIEHGAVTALAVEMRFDGDGSGRTTLQLSDSVDHGDGAKPDLQHLQVSGATVESAAQDHEVLRAKPGAPIVVRYRIVSGYDGLPAGQPFHALLQPSWFAVHGERLFLAPAGRADASAQVRVLGLPPGWISASDLGPGGAQTVADVTDGYLIGGAGWRELDQPIGAAKLRFFYRPEAAPAHPEEAAALLARIAAADFAFWRDAPWDLFVPIVPTGGDSGGRGLFHGFLVAAAHGDDLAAQQHTFAHEHTHSWISRQIGGYPATHSDAEAWLNEGFTELTTARELVSAGLWAPQDFADDLNAALLEYGTSPAKTAPNSRIDAERFSNWDVGKLPYYRGRLLGLLWERRLRQATGGKVGLQDVLQAQRVLARRARSAGQTTSADLLFPIAVRQAAGVDLTADLATYVDHGAAISLPADLFGACGTLDTVTQPVFDRGFDLIATVRNDHRLVGLEPGGPAERAGLREGERLGIDEVISHDSQKPLTYRVAAPGGGQIAITYKPEGAGTVSFQRFRLDPSLDAAAQARCVAQLTGRP